MNNLKSNILAIALLINNVIAATLLGITFLTGPAYGTPFWRIVLGLSSYVFIVSVVFSLITMGILALIKRLKPQLTTTYLKAFLGQMALLVGGYLIVYLFIHLRFQLDLFQEI